MVYNLLLQFSNNLDTFSYGVSYRTWENFGEPYNIGEEKFGK